MRTVTRTVLVLAAVLLIVGAMPTRAQEPSIAQGQLMRVDANARMIAIRTSEGSQMRFSYTDDTKVIGADEGVSGLATMAGTDVTIHYFKNQTENVATQIEVLRKQ
jgi:hypothetical protein